MDERIGLDSLTDEGDDDMAGIKELARGRKTIYMMSPDDIYVKEGWNVRDLGSPENVEALEILARSIAKEGVRDALTIKDDGEGKYFVLDGHRRFAAVALANSDFGAEIVAIPCILADRNMSEAEAFALQISSSNEKEALSPFEYGKACLRFKKWGWDEKSLAERFNVNVSRIYGWIKAFELPDDIKEAVENKRIALTSAQELINEEGEEAVREALATGEVVKKLSDAVKMKIIFNFASVSESEETATLVIEKEHFEWLKKKILLDKTTAKYDNFVDKYGQVEF